MTLDEYNEFCATLLHTNHVVQWGEAHVWKIDKKMFAVGGWNKDSDGFAVTFKVGEIAFEMLRDVEGCRPAPYLASRGMKWIQRTGDGYMNDAELKGYLRESYRLVSLNLTKKKQKELGLNQGGAG